MFFLRNRLLHEAKESHLEQLSSLIAGGADVDMRGYDGETLLMLAARQSLEDARKWLTAEGIKW